MAQRSGYIGRHPGDGNSAIVRQTYSLTSETTELSFTAGYIVGFVDVYLNGVKLIDTEDYEATNASTIGLTTAAPSGDVVEVVAYKALNVGSVTNANANFSVAGDTTLSGTVSVASTATLSGVTTCEGDLYVGGDLYVLDDIVYDEVSGRNLNITGVATAATIHVGSATTIDGSGVNVTGVITATSFSGDGSSLTGIAVTSDINTNNIKVSGISTLGTAAATTLDVAGIATVNANGSQITGVSTFDGNVHLLDNKTLYFGGTPGTTTGDLQLFHDASHSYIRDQGTGDIRVRAAGFDVREATNALSILRTDASGFMATTGIGTVTRLETTDANVSGIITATQYKGDGSALTGVGGEFDITSCLFI